MRKKHSRDNAYFRSLSSYIHRIYCLSCDKLNLFFKKKHFDATAINMAQRIAAFFGAN